MKTAYAEVSQPVRRKRAVIATSHQGGEAYKRKKSDVSRARRFLILGTESGSFYQGTKKLTLENTKLMRNLLADPVTGPEVVREIVTVSTEGLAPKQDATLFSLALATRSPDLQTRTDAYNAIIPVCRTLSQLYTFIAYRFSIGGIDEGRFVGEKIKNARDPRTRKFNDERYGGHASSMGFRKAIQRWLKEKSDDDLLYQVVKYPERDGISFRDVLRIARPRDMDGNRSSMYAFSTKGEIQFGQLHPDIARKMVMSIVAKSEYVTAEQAADCIINYGMPREAIRTELLNDLGVWFALLKDMPVTALVRNLGKMTSIGLFANEVAARTAIDRLSDGRKIKNSRIHPMTIYTAMTTYARGSGVKGSFSWNPDRRIQSALEEAFDLSFKNVVPSGKNILVAIDTSVSMSAVADTSSMASAAELAGIMSLVILRTEPNARVIGISDRINENIGIYAHQRPVDAASKARRALGGGTDLSLPFLITRRDKSIDAVVLFTDSENGVRNNLPMHQQVFCQRSESSRIVLAQMVANKYGWTPPQFVGLPTTSWDDVGRKSLEIVGFDPSIGKLTSDFLSERF